MFRVGHAVFSTAIRCVDVAVRATCFVVDDPAPAWRERRRTAPLVRGRRCTARCSR